MDGTPHHSTPTKNRKASAFRHAIHPDTASISVFSPFHLCKPRANPYRYGRAVAVEAQAITHPVIAISHQSPPPPPHAPCLLLASSPTLLGCLPAIPSIPSSPSHLLLISSSPSLALALSPLHQSLAPVHAASPQHTCISQPYIHVYLGIGSHVSYCYTDACTHDAFTLMAGDEDGKAVLATGENLSNHCHSWNDTCDSSAMDMIDYCTDASYSYCYTSTAIATDATAKAGSPQASKISFGLVSVGCSCCSCRVG